MNCENMKIIASSNICLSLCIFVSANDKKKLLLFVKIYYSHSFLRYSMIEYWNVHFPMEVSELLIIFSQFLWISLRLSLNISDARLLVDLYQNIVTGTAVSAWITMTAFSSTLTTGMTMIAFPTIRLQFVRWLGLGLGLGLGLSWIVALLNLLHYNI